MQKLFSAAQIRAWDAYTIQHEPISSLALMERAALAFVNWFCTKFSSSQYSIYIFCGVGNNGGDGFAICRLLQQKGYNATPYLVGSLNKLRVDCYSNYKKLTQVQLIHNLTNINKLKLAKNSIIIDALFGSGLTRPLRGIYNTLINHLNFSKAIKIAVDIPSGMFCDTIHYKTSTIFKSDYTISFQLPKRAFFLPENKRYIKEFIIVSIGLSNKYYEKTPTNWFLCNLNTDKLPVVNYTYTHLSKTTNSIKKIAYLMQEAKAQQKTICYKNKITCIVTPKEKIYLIVK